MEKPPPLPFAYGRSPRKKNIYELFFFNQYTSYFSAEEVILNKPQ